MTAGDPAGIGPEILAAAWRALRSEGPVFLAIADPEALARLTGVPVATIADPAEAETVFGRALPVLPLSWP
ncbi:MAG: 4-hydroxythreonine-4-phosphate dehydrogenase, partial [Alphaproteobacteria bacterium]